MNGKGEIRDVELNCSALNETLSKMTPFVELETVHVSKLSFHVSSWTNIRKAPILVHVEHVTATVKEPLHYVDRAKRRQFRQVTRGELVEMIRAGIVKARGAYVSVMNERMTCRVVGLAKVIGLTKQSALFFDARIFLIAFSITSQSKLHPFRSIFNLGDVSRRDERVRGHRPSCICRLREFASFRSMNTDKKHLRKKFGDTITIDRLRAVY